MERDLTHWTKWDDSELIDQAAAACQSAILMEDSIVRDAISMNVIAPFRQEIERLKNEIEGMHKDATGASK